MKWIWIAFALFAAVSAIDHDDLRKLTIGFIDGIEILEDKTRLIACIEDHIGLFWDSSVKEITKIQDGKDPTMVLLAFTSLLSPTLGTLALLTPCSKGEIDRISEHVKHMVYNPDELLLKTHQNIDMIKDSLKDFLVKWEQSDFVEAGRVSGAIVNWIFVKE